MVAMNNSLTCVDTVDYSYIRISLVQEALSVKEAGAVVPNRATFKYSYTFSSIRSVFLYLYSSTNTRRYKIWLLLHKL